jgi:hypothetical protein
MSFGIDYPVISTGNLFTSIDPYVSTGINNGALNIPGAIYQAPINSATIATKGPAPNGYFKYVRYNPTVTQVLKTGPVLVYWKDETFTTTTGLASEAFSGINNIAGWMLYNTTTTSAAVATDINGNYCWIQVGGLLVGAWVTAAAAADASIYGASSTFGATGTTAANTAPPNKVAGWSLAAAASNLVDLYVPLLV